MDGYAATTQDIVDAIMRHNPDARIEYEYDPEYQRVMDTEYANLLKRTDDSLARQDWDWSPHYTLDTAVADFIHDVQTGATLQA